MQNRIIKTDTILTMVFDRLCFCKTKCMPIHFFINLPSGSGSSTKEFPVEEDIDGANEASLSAIK